MLEAYNQHHANAEALEDSIHESAVTDCIEIDHLDEISDRIQSEMLADVASTRPAYKLVLDDSQFGDDPVSSVLVGDFSDIQCSVSPDFTWELTATIREFGLVIVGGLTDEDAIVVGHRKNPETPFVAIERVLDQYYESDTCPCSVGCEPMSMGRSGPIRCRCGRNYLKHTFSSVTSTESACTPTEVDNGIVKITDEQWDPSQQSNMVNAFWTLSQHAPRVVEYMEDCSRADDGAYLLAHEGEYIGLLYARHNEIVAVVISYTHRREGHGTRFVENWVEQNQHDAHRVSAFADTQPFVDQLDIDMTDEHLTDEAGFPLQ